jgi:hypothetical protein
MANERMKISSLIYVSCYGWLNWLGCLTDSLEDHLSVILALGLNDGPSYMQLPADCLYASRLEARPLLGF